MTDLNQIVDNIVEIINSKPEKRIAKRDLEAILIEKHSYEITEKAIHQIIETNIVDVVIDFYPLTSDQSKEESTWFLRLLSNEEKKRLIMLNDMQRAFLQLLRVQNNPNHLGQIRFEEVQELLLQQGFDVRDSKELCIENRTSVFWTLHEGKEMKWCYLIPEWEKTKEYKQSLEESYEEWRERQSFRSD